jgi:preprotein translocase subunit SecE
VAKKSTAKKQLSRRPTKKQPKRQTGFFKRLSSETVGELRRVTWPTQREARSLTWVVVMVMAIMGIFLGFLDYVFFEFFGLIFGT